MNVSAQLVFNWGFSLPGLRGAAAGEPRLMTEDKTGALFHVVPSDAANRYGSLVRERKHLLSPSLREN
jgi:hypothetical protein